MHDLGPGEGHWEDRPLRKAEDSRRKHFFSFFFFKLSLGRKKMSEKIKMEGTLLFT